ncbi:MAG: DUF262 domain-containing protein [Clostridiales Family XIII bacterium]|jgi:hypothetical protein|nr:DUF262 domain-containing protein [Clostridiales Family XIII bacterium]
MRELSFYQLITTNHIRIPIIQRDYAQGRENIKVTSIRDNFLDAIFQACSEKKPLHLDFIFGEIEGPIFLPFDGQQRLTTLYLLHWYAATRENLLSKNDNEIRNYLRKFCYEVRDDTRIFGKSLVDSDIHKEHPWSKNIDTKPDNNAISEYIKAEPWFRYEWRLDPTISGMLTMLDSIHSRFYSLKGLWDILTQEPYIITFHYAELKNLFLSADETYIKMNSRGKQLTEFEYFKARFIEKLIEDDGNDPNFIREISGKLDNEWINFFWKLSVKNTKNTDKAYITDSNFVSFLRYMTDIFLHWSQPANDSQEDMPKLDCYKDDLFVCFSEAINPDRDQIWKFGNLKFLVSILDKFVEIEKCNQKKNSSNSSVDHDNCIDAYLKEHFFVLSPFLKIFPYKHNNHNKISIHSSKFQLFHDCCSVKDGKSGLDLDEKLLFFACLLQILQDQDIDHTDASLRFRVLRNILENSRNELREESFSSQLKEVYKLMTQEIKSIAEKTKFNTEQVLEEKSKIIFRESNKTDDVLIQAINYLEDHPFLQGHLALFSQANSEKLNKLFDKETIITGKHFFEIAFGSEPVDFNCIIRALLSQVDYADRFGYQRKYLGNPLQETKNYNCHHIFTSLHNYQEFLKAVQALATQTKSSNNKEELDQTLNDIADSWVKECESLKKFDWRYYFLKYSGCLPYHNESGLYFWGYHNQSFTQTKLSGERRNTLFYSPFLLAAIIEAGLYKETKQDKFFEVEQLEKENLSFIVSTDSSKMSLFFKGIDLALWLDEFSWRIWDKDFNKDSLNSVQDNILKRLKSDFNKIENVDKIENDGWIHIKGKDSHEHVDHTNYNYDNYRLYDSEDRIKLIIELIKTMYDLNNEQLMSTT